MTMSRIIITISLLLIQVLGFPQVPKQIFNFELGTLISVGPNTRQEDTISINDLTSIVYPVNKRFEHPSLRIRVGWGYLFGEKFFAGAELGFNFRYRDSDYEGELEYSIPIQGRFAYNVFEISSRLGLSVDFTGGYHVHDFSKYAVEESGGLIFSSSVILSQNNITSSQFYFKFGFERQTENVTYTILPRSPGQKDEYYDTKRYRNQLIFSIGLTLE